VKWLSQQTFNLPVQGSNPCGPTICKHINQYRSSTAGATGFLVGSMPTARFVSVFTYGVYQSALST
jgi:hypothetical protein